MYVIYGSGRVETLVDNLESNLYKILTTLCLMRQIPVPVTELLFTIIALAQLQQRLLRNLEKQFGGDKLAVVKGE